MSNEVTNELLAKLNQTLGEGPLFFIAAEAERGLGLEGLLQNYQIVATRGDSIVEILKAEGKGALFNVDGGTTKLAESPEFIEFIKAKTQGFLSTNKKCYLQYFKSTDTAVADKITEEGFSVTVLNNTPVLTRELENKIKQYQLLTEAGLGDHLPQGEVKALKDIDLQGLTHDPEHNYVVQLPFGHTGLSTYFLQESEAENTTLQLLEIQKQFPNRIAKLSKQIQGNPFTVNACVYRGQIYVGGLSYQYTGIPGVTAIPAATVGNDWALPEILLSADQRKKLVEITRQAGQLLSISKGFQGIYGVDFIVENSTGKPYVLEINPRQVASIAMHTKLQLEHGQVPLLALHLAEFLDIEVSLNPLEYSNQAIMPMNASQVFLRSIRRQDYSVPDLPFKSGIYRQQSDNTARELIAANQAEKVIFLDAEDDRPLIWQSQGKSLDDFNEEGFLLLLKSPAEKVAFNEEIARLQLRRSAGQVIGNDVKLIPLVNDTFKKLRTVIED